MSDLADAIQRCGKWLSRHRSQSRPVGEQNTKAGLVEPILEALGWDIREPDEVCREYRRVPGDNPVDYALLILRTPRLFVEAKGLGADLDDRRWANQTIAYATAAGVEWVVLTNGAEWRIYNAHAPVPIEQKLFRTVSLEEDPGDVERTLRLIGKDNMGENRIAELWKTNFIDRQVREVLGALFASGEPAKEIVSLVRRQVQGVSLHDIRESLGRARAHFEFPTVVDEPASHAPEPAPPASTPREPRRPGSRRVPAELHSGPRRKLLSDAERAISLATLMERGLLQPGAVIRSTYGGGHHEAVLLGADRIRYNGEDYPSLSRAGEALKLALRGPNLPTSVRATDGWSFWRAIDRDTGRLISLRELRRRAAEQ